MVANGRDARRWGAYAALGIAILAVLGSATWLFHPRYPDVPSRDRAHAPQHAYQAGGEGCRPDRLRLLPNTAKANGERTRCAEAAQNEQRAQEAVSEARYASDIAKQALLVSEYQGWAFFWQALAAIAALIAAGVAAYFAMRAVRAADKTLEHARASSERELRAYVYPESVRIKRTSPGKWEIYFRFKNFGSTPAHKVDAVWGAEVVKSNGEEPRDDIDFDGASLFGSLAPTDSVWFHLDVKGTVNLTSLSRGKQAIVFAGKINYENVFIEDQLTGFNHTWFRYYVGGDEPISLSQLVGVGEGPEMSAASFDNDAE
jgi:hypothetical protein